MLTLQGLPQWASSLAGVRLVRDCDAAYRIMCERLAGEPSATEEALACCLQHLAEFCQFHHSGRFADGRLENLALELAEQLGQLLPPRNVSCPGLNSLAMASSRRHILHVATSVQEIGGHTRTILRWIESDPASCHSLVLIRQDGSAVPAWLRAAIQASGGTAIEFPQAAPVLLRAWWLRQAAQYADLVILHHFGYDVTPVIALGVAEGPPVALVNHADHLFWLGSSVADLIIQQRGLSRVLGPERRCYRRDALVPIPLSPPLPTPSRAEARKSLGIPENQTVLVSVGRATKYVPTSQHHFVRAITHLLDRCPAAHLYLLGVSASDTHVLVGWPIHPRLHLCGSVPHAALHLRAADVYLEGVPFGSQTALLEAALEGVPAVRAYAPPLDLLAGSDEALDDLLPVPASEEEYVERAAALVNHRSECQALGEELRRRVLESHVGNGWRGRLHGAYRQAMRMHHQPYKLPDTSCLTTARDVALSAWQARQHGPPQGVAAIAKQVELAGAYLAREGGDYRGAFAILWRWLRSDQADRPVVRALLRLLPHWALRQVRSLRMAGA
jgi:glycosyltransferase involved in cell wall biosynthesis